MGMVKLVEELLVIQHNNNMGYISALKLILSDFKAYQRGYNGNKLKKLSEYYSLKEVLYILFG